MQPESTRAWVSYKLIGRSIKFSQPPPPYPLLAFALVYQNNIELKQIHFLVFGFILKTYQDALKP